MKNQILKWEFSSFLFTFQTFPATLLNGHKFILHSFVIRTSSVHATHSLALILDSIFPFHNSIMISCLSSFILFFASLRELNSFNFHYFIGFVDIPWLLFSTAAKIWKASSRHFVSVKCMTAETGKMRVICRINSPGIIGRINSETTKRLSSHSSDWSHVAVAKANKTSFYMTIFVLQKRFWSLEIDSLNQWFGPRVAKLTLGRSQ